MSSLANQTCESCELGAPLVSEGDQAKLLAGLDGWEIDNGEVSKLIKDTVDAVEIARENTGATETDVLIGGIDKDIKSMASATIENMSLKDNE